MLFDHLAVCITVMISAVVFPTVCNYFNCLFYSVSHI